MKHRKRNLRNISHLLSHTIRLIIFGLIYLPYYISVSYALPIQDFHFDLPPGYYNYEPPVETVPNAPNLQAIWKDQSSIKLLWVDHSKVEHGYKLQQLDESGAWNTMGDFQALNDSKRGESYVVDNLAPNTRYCFKLIAYNNYGESKVGDEQQVCTNTGGQNSCSGDDVAKVLTRADEDDYKIHVKCDLSFEPYQVITKRLMFIGDESSGVTVDLNGATLSGYGTVNDGEEMIQVISRESEARNEENQISSYERPENITIKNGTIYGKVRIWGMARNGQGDEDDDKEGNPIPHSNQFKKSSRTHNHTQRARMNAPTNIVFDNLTIDATGTFYFGPGVTNSKIINSELKGRTSRSAIYLGAESAGNVLKNNYIHTDTARDKTGDRIPGMKSRGWPLINVDGSSHNKIVNNYFSSLDNGGIYLYRNCGEGGVIRHATPSNNHIINNTFYYANYGGLKPSVFLSSRDYGWKENLGHCKSDAGYPYGSSKSNKDHARFNVVMQNQFFERPFLSISKSKASGLWIRYIQTRNRSLNSPNFIDYNEEVNEQTVTRNRPAGCYVTKDYRGFIFDSETFDEYKSANITYRYTCVNGDIQRKKISNWHQDYRQFQFLNKLTSP